MAKLPKKLAKTSLDGIKATPKTIGKIVPKRAKKKLSKVQDKTAEYVKGDQLAPASTAPEKVSAKSIKRQRSKILAEGRKFIYPLRHAKHRIVLISAALGTLVFLGVALFVYLGLYRQQATSNIYYRTTEVLPLPVGNVNGDRVQYEEYLFELRQMLHFTVNKDKVDFNTEEGKQRLDVLKTQAKEKVIENVVTRQLADELDIKVIDEEVEQEVQSFREQEGLVIDPDVDQVDILDDKLQEFFGWDVNDFRRELRLQLLQQKIVIALDTPTRDRAEKAKAELDDGGDFGEVAKEYSADTSTTEIGGAFPEPITSDDTNLPKVIVDVGFATEEDQYSDITQSVFENNNGVNVVSLHIIKNLKDVSSTERRLAHILFVYKNFDDLVADRIKEATENSNFYIDFPDLGGDSSAEE